MPSLTKIGLVVVGACSCAALGVAGSLAFAEPVTPSSLATPTHAPHFPVGSAEFDDARPVELKLTRSDDRTVVAPVSGRVTTSLCTVGEPLESGKPVMAVDGTPLLGLASSVPLWRDLVLGDTGDDVLALKAELSRLGYDVGTEGPLTRGVLRALRDLDKQAGHDRLVDHVEIARIVWLPATSTVVSECTAQVGSAVAEGDEIATVPGALVDVSIARVPDGLLPGQRVLVVDGVGVAVDPATAISDPVVLEELSALRSLQPAESEDAAGPAAPPTAQLRLATPEAVSVVPPASVFGVTDGRGCVLSEDMVRRVTVVGSQLGQTYVVFDEASSPTTVDTDPAPGTPCT